VPSFFSETAPRQARVRVDDDINKKKEKKDAHIAHQTAPERHKNSSLR
jgi:hypothetical protein